MRALWITMASVGVTTLVLGILSFVYGGWVLEGSQPYRFGHLAGSWRPAQYAFAGTIAAALGAGFITAGLLGLRTDRGRRPEDRE